MKATWRTLRWPIEPRCSAAGRTSRASILVELRDGDLIGLGEGTVFGSSTYAPELVDITAARDFAGIEVALDAHAICDPAARFALETAWLDLEARRRGVTIAELLAPSPPASMPCAVVVDDPAEAAACGARTIKIKVARGIEHVRAIAAAAPGTRLRLDANRAWSVDDARARLAALADLPIELVEEPCADIAALFDSAEIPPIALDESLAELDDAAVERRLALRAITALVLKPSLLGIARCLRLASIARAHGIAVVVTHALEGPIGTAACAELARAIGTADAGLAPHPALAGWAIQPPQLTGTAIVAAGPGLAFARDLHAVVAAAPMTSVPRVIVIPPTSGAEVDERDTVPHLDAFVAEPTAETVHAIRAALDRGRPLALLHARLAPEELARQRAVVARAQVPPGTAFVLFTSGSTGEPRGVVLSRKAIVAAAEASVLGWREDDAWLLALSTAHAGGLAVVVRCLIARKPIVLADDVRAGLERATLASLVPAQLAALLDDPAWRPPPHLRAVLLGGAAAPASLVEAALARGVPVYPTYGMTETFGQIATAREPGGPLVPLPGVDLTARAGRLHVRGPMLATCYLDGAPIAPEFATPDLGEVTGVLRITGRADDVIITGGENVHPAQIEAVLAATPGVRAAVAFGVPDARWGQLVAAALAVDAAFDLAAAATRWRDALPPHARPRRVVTRDTLPLLPTGKLDRRAAAQLPTQVI